MLKVLLLCVFALALAACGGGAGAPGSTGGSLPASSPSSPNSAKPVASAAPSAGASGAPKPAASVPGQLKQIRLAVPTKGSAFSYLYVAQDLGLFQKRGLDAQINVIPPANAVTALQSGDLDYAATVGSTIRAALRGLPVRVVMIGSNHPDFMLLGAKGVTAVEELKGKNIGVDAPQTTSYLMLAELLKRKGFQQSDYKTVTAANDEARMALLTSGTVPATVVELSTGVTFAKQGYPVLANISDMPEAPFVGLGASQAGIKNKRDVLLAGLGAAMDGVDAMRTQKNAVLPFMSKDFDLSAEDAANVFDALQPSWAANGRPTQAATDFELANDKVAMELKDTPAPDQVYDFSLLDEIGKK